MQDRANPGPLFRAHLGFTQLEQLIVDGMKYPNGYSLPHTTIPELHLTYLLYTTQAPFRDHMVTVSPSR